MHACHMHGLTAALVHYYCIPNHIHVYAHTWISSGDMTMNIISKHVPAPTYAFSRGPQTWSTYGSISLKTEKWVQMFQQLYNVHVWTSLLILVIYFFQRSGLRLLCLATQDQALIVFFGVTYYDASLPIARDLNAIIWHRPIHLPKWIYILCWYKWRKILYISFTVNHTLL